MDRRHRALLGLTAGLLFGLAPLPSGLHAQSGPRISVEATPAPVNAPVSPRGLEEPPPVRRVVLNIDREGRLTLNQEPAVLSQEELGLRLQRLRQEQGDGFSLVVRPARDLPYGTTMRLLDKLRSIGITNVAFAAGAKPAEEAAGVTKTPPGPTAPETARERIKTAMMSTRPGPDGAAAHVAQLAPGERKTFEDNLHLWRQMPPEERMALRRQANQRNQEEIAGALWESGLRLSPDQQEMFALRYLQERRKLEREIQDQANAERARRLPLILQSLKREFGADKPPSAAPAVPSAVVR